MRKKLKIAIITHLSIPIRQPYAGGSECFVHLLAKKLIERGHEVTVFSVEGTDQAINPHFIYPLTWNLTEDYKKLMYYLQDTDFDIVHNNSFSDIPALYSDVLKVPMVTTVHMPIEHHSYNLVNHYNNTYVTVSHYLRKNFAKVINSEVIYNGINLENFKYTLKTHKENYILWSGRIVKEKGTKYAIKAAKKLKLPLKIAGPIRCNKYFKKYIKPYLNNDIEYLGVLPHNELSKLIEKARVCLVASIWNEPYGLVVAEALACGTPVAAFTSGAIPELLNEKTGALAKPKDVNGLCKAILKAMNLSPEDCRKRAEEIADLNKMVDKYEDLYYRLAL